VPDEQPTPVKHLATERFGKTALRAAHDITAGLAASGAEDDGVVVLRIDGPHRTLSELESLIDDVLADEAPS